jgi:hypothetical protein
VHSGKALKEVGFAEGENVTITCAAADPTIFQSQQAAGEIV